MRWAPRHTIVAITSLAPWACAKDALVFLGATGDNALRPSGVWQGLYEAWAGNEFEKVGGVDLHVAMNTPHTWDELQNDVLKSLAPLHDKLQKLSGWECLVQNGDCSPERFLQGVTVNIWKGRDADAQAANMSAALHGYSRITVYLSIPPFAYLTWTKAALDHWTFGDPTRVHVAAEKPFGTSLQDADSMYKNLTDAGMPDGNLHLVDHWLSFFMVRNLPALRSIAGNALGFSWSGAQFGRVVVTEYEERGLDGRGEFFDGVGQVRDMVQSHLLQVLALTLMDDSAASNRNHSKLDVLDSTEISDCQLGQYDGFLFEPKLKYHGTFADSTLCKLSLAAQSGSWAQVPLVIATGKNMGSTLYTIDLYQRQGPGILTFNIGKEETGLGSIALRNWPLKDASDIDAPAAGFDSDKTVKMTPNVSGGNGYILNYSDPGLYFPKPYAVMTSALLTRDYSAAFVSFAECERSWQIVSSRSSSLCLDPSPETVSVYKPPDQCGNPPARVCWEKRSVADLYENTFACTPEHDAKYANVSFYQAKCRSRGRPEFFV